MDSVYRSACHRRLGIVKQQLAAARPSHMRLAIVERNGSSITLFIENGSSVLKNGTSLFQMSVQ
jgi:hypothetical protein